MPNWCSNVMTVYGTKEDLSSFLVDVVCTNDDGSEEIRILDNLVPIPEVLVGSRSPAATEESVQRLIDRRDANVSGEWDHIDDEAIQRERDLLEQAEKALAETGSSDWYHWCIKNWGTKWGDCETRLVHEDSLEDECPHLIFIFDTAWGPMDAGLIEVSKLRPNLKFVTKYEESGMGFLGAFAIHNGEMAYDKGADSQEDIYPDYPEDDGEDDFERWAEWNDLTNELSSFFERNAQRAVGITPSSLVKTGPSG